MNIDTSLTTYNSFTNINSNGVEEKKEYGNKAPTNLPEIIQMGINGDRSSNEAVYDYMKTLGVGFDSAS
jgi:hypothetical protein